MRANVEIGRLRDEERFKLAGNAAADAVVYELMADFPPTAETRRSLVAKVLLRYGDALRWDQAVAIVDALVVQEHMARDRAARLRAEEKLLRGKRRRAA